MCEDSDIDIFYVQEFAPEEVTPQDYIKHVLHKIADLLDGCQYAIFMTSNTLTLDLHGKKIQFIMFPMKTLDELLLLFDLDCVQCALTSDNVYCTWNFLKSMHFRSNIFSPRFKYFGPNLQRVIKYGERTIKTFINSDWHPLEHMFTMSDLSKLYSMLTFLIERVPMYTRYRTATLYFAGANKQLLDTFDGKAIANAKNYEAMHSRWFPQDNVLRIFLKKNDAKLQMKNYMDNVEFRALCFLIDKCRDCKRYFPISLTKNLSRHITNADIIHSQCIGCFHKQSKALVVLSHHDVLIFGGKTGVGYECALLLLRSGAQVTITTRVVEAALEKFSNERDFEEWGDRLFIVQFHINIPINFHHALDRTFPHYNYTIVINALAHPEGYDPVMTESQFYLPYKSQVLQYLNSTSTFSMNGDGTFDTYQKLSMIYYEDSKEFCSPLHERERTKLFNAVDAKALFGDCLVPLLNTLLQKMSRANVTIPRFVTTMVSYTYSVADVQSMAIPMLQNGIFVNGAYAGGHAKKTALQILKPVLQHTEQMFYGELFAAIV